MAAAANLGEAKTLAGSALSLNRDTTIMTDPLHAARFPGNLCTEIRVGATVGGAIATNKFSLLRFCLAFRYRDGGSDPQPAGAPRLVPVGRRRHYPQRAQFWPGSFGQPLWLNQLVYHGVPATQVAYTLMSAGSNATRSAR